jgi:hypothetical protein
MCTTVLFLMEAGEGLGADDGVDMRKGATAVVKRLPHAQRKMATEVHAITAGLCDIHRFLPHQCHAPGTADASSLLNICQVTGTWSLCEQPAKVTNLILPGG